MIKDKLKVFINSILGVKTIQKIKLIFVSICVRKNKLSWLAWIFGSDKNGNHFYTQHYDNYFFKFRKKKNIVIEVGVGGYRESNSGGCSLKMWKAYFTKSLIYGIDIYDKSFLDESRVKTFKGDQTDIDFLESVIIKTGQPDIIIDDGSHISMHTIETFRFLFPKLKSGGFYVIEDLQTSYWPTWGGSKDLNEPLTIMNFLKRLIDGLNYEEFLDPNYLPTYTDLNISGIYFHHNICFIKKGDNREGSNSVKNGMLVN